MTPYRHYRLVAIVLGLATLAEGTLWWFARVGEAPASATGAVGLSGLFGWVGLMCLVLTLVTASLALKHRPR